MVWAAVAVWGALCIGMLVDAVSLDPTVTKQLEQVIKKDKFIIAINHIKPKRRIVHASETLFSIDFPESQQKFALELDRKTKRVIVETLEGGRHHTQHFTVDTLHEDNLIHSFILAVVQNESGAYATLYLDCMSYGMISTPKSMRDMYTSMNNPRLEVFREKKYPMYVDGQKDLRMVLSKNECPFLPNDDIFDYSTLQKDQPIITPRKDHRSDIPIISDVDCNNIIDTLNKLIKVVNVLIWEVDNNTMTVERLRGIIEECELCKVRPPPIILPKCATHNPCAPRVHCFDSDTGPRCGPCPSGFIGNGYECRPGRTCRDRPCFNGVQCHDTEDGYTCGSCPPGYEGNGEKCRRINRCEYNPCAPGCLPFWRHQTPVQSSSRIVSSYNRHPYQ